MYPTLRPRKTGSMSKVDSYLQNFTDRAAQSRIRNFPALPLSCAMIWNSGWALIHRPSFSGAELERATLSSIQFTILPK